MSATPSRADPAPRHSMPSGGLIVTLAVLSMAGALGIDAYLPSFPAIRAAFGVDALVVQQTLSIYIAAMAATVLFAGALSDSFGRRPVVLASLLVFTGGSLAALVAPDIHSLIAARALQGMAAGFGMVLARTIVQDRFSGHEAVRAMALVGMVFGLAPAVAPLIGGWLQTHWGWRSVFGFLALYGALLWATCQWGLPETLAPAQRTPLRLGGLLARYGRALAHPVFMLRAGGLALVFTGVALHVSSAANYVIDILGLDESRFGWLFIPMIGGIVLGSAVAERLARRAGVEALNRWGFALMLAGALISALYVHRFEPRVPYAVMPLALYGFGLALALPGMMVSTLELLPDMRGLAASMQSFVQMLVFALIAGVLAPLVFHSARALALTHLAGVLLGLALWLLADRLRGSRAAHAA